MLLNTKKTVSACPSWMGFVCGSVAMGAAAWLALPSMSLVAFAGPDDEDRKPRERQRDMDREVEERERIERREREERSRIGRAGDPRRRDEAAAQREREERIHHLERALAEARERRENGRGSDDEIAELERQLDRARSSGRRVRMERREVHAFRRPDSSEEQRDLIRQQMELLDEALKQEEIRRNAGAVDHRRFLDLRTQRLQLERELIHHLPERGPEELERERGIVREQIEMAAEAVARVEQQSQFLGKPGASLEFKMRLLGLKRELAALNAPQREVRVFRREVFEGHPREEAARRPEEMEREHAEQRERMELEHRERHERAVAEAEERARRAHEQAERRLQESVAKKEAVKQRDLAVEQEKRAAEAGKVAELQRKRAEEHARLAEKQRAELKAELETERNRRAALEKELKALRERLKALEDKKTAN